MAVCSNVRLDVFKFQIIFEDVELKFSQKTVARNVFSVLAPQESTEGTRFVRKFISGR